MQQCWPHNTVGSLCKRFTSDGWDVAVVYCKMVNKCMVCVGGVVAGKKMVGSNGPNSLDISGVETDI